MQIQGVKRSQHDNGDRPHQRDGPVRKYRGQIGVQQHRRRCDWSGKADNERDGARHVTQCRMQQAAQIIVFATGVRKIGPDLAVAKRTTECDDAAQQPGQENVAAAGASSPFRSMPPGIGPAAGRIHHLQAAGKMFWL